ncbi:protein arginine kinase [Clostridium sp. B9]|uniref:protein arginine kinase n=1 Tax=Clostridium sp. B9 TaxID=3423224 RepID=UPI003D2EE93B
MMIQWISPQSNNSVVIASKVILFRNLKGIKFAQFLNKGESKQVIDRVLNALKKKNILDKCYTSRLDEEKYLLEYEKENFGIARDFINISNMALITSESGNFSILLNEEEHIGIESTKSGLNLKEAYTNVDKLDDLIDEELDYSFSEEFGYLTSNVKKAGTGLIAKSIIHLPILSLNNCIREIREKLLDEGISIKSTYRLGSKEVGNIYEITNLKTLGLTEIEILDSITSITNKIVLQEKNAREKLFKNGDLEIKDTIFRALGTLKNAYIIDINEALRLLSYVRLGVETGIIEGVNLEVINSAMVGIQPAIINKTLETKLNIQSLKIERAKIIRNALNT